MCGIFAAVGFSPQKTKQIQAQAGLVKTNLAHRGPDAAADWISPDMSIYMFHARLKIIDLVSGNQPMHGCDLDIIFNGEIYNYKELRDELRGSWHFKTQSDTEVILAAYAKWGENCVTRFRGMFAFALWDQNQKKLFCARDHFGIKPFYYADQNGSYYFASEIKALLPFLKDREVNPEALKDYLFFQLYLHGKTLFRGVQELPPAHLLVLQHGKLQIRRYWEVHYRPELGQKESYFQDRLADLMDQSIDLHLRSDVPVGAYVSGGLDSSLVATLAARKSAAPMRGYHGRFSEGPSFDESRYAQVAARHAGMNLEEILITPQDFIRDISKVIWHLDQPVAGPGSFPQFCVSRLAASRGKVVLGGQGGDEVFGGYVRYLVAYFEQCIRGGIEGTLHNGNYIVTYESIIPNLRFLKGYEPMLQEFWREGLFGPMDRRYFRLVNRAPDLSREVRWSELGSYDPFDSFEEIFNGQNVGHEAYFDKMTHFDFKTLLPALLHVEDRMSMAHGLESRVPFLDVPLVEFAATIPADVKFKEGRLKRLPLETFRNVLPEEITSREDKMGFPVPLQAWFRGPLREFVQDTFRSQKARERSIFNSEEILHSLEREPKFGRKIWGLLSLELWFQLFMDTPPASVEG
jgi:asparagine synthase (glutamine-hydrolysing)